MVQVVYILRFCASLMVFVAVGVSYEVPELAASALSLPTIICGNVNVGTNTQLHHKGKWFLVNVSSLVFPVL